MVFSDFAPVRPLPTLAVVCAGTLALAGCGGSGGKADTAATGTTAASTATNGTAGSTGAGSASTGVAGAATRGATSGQATGSHEVSAHEAAAAVGTVTATLRVAGGHHPRVGEHWPIAFAVRNAGAPAKAEVSYEYLFAGAVVAHRSHYRFTGAFHDLFVWPASAVGYPLTFRAVIVSSGRTLNLDYPVQVVR